MLDLVRDSTVGGILNHISGGRILPYADQKPGYQPSNRYRFAQSTARDEKALSSPASLQSPQDDPELGGTKTPPANSDTVVSKEAHLSQANVIDNAVDPNLVDWDGPDDPDNPMNWSFKKRLTVHFALCLLTVSVYIGSAIYTASIPGVITHFHVSPVVSTLGLSLYVLAYGIGPMVFCPLQEVPAIGRRPVYIVTLLIFVCLQVPTALAPNIGSLLVLRFLAGFFCSPVLATGGASIADMFLGPNMPYPMALWAMFGVAGPVFGPIVGGFAAQAKGWQWPIWELLWLSGGTLILLLFFFPETLGDTILYKRAKRLRKLTGNKQLRSASEIKMAQMKPTVIAIQYLVRPFQLMMEPAVFFINLYVGLAYAVFYLWFEAFPLVFVDLHGFKQGSAFVYVLYIYYYLNPKWMRQGYLTPEERLVLAVVSGPTIPISLFIFGWTAKRSIHWIAPVIGASLYIPGLFLLFQSAIIYLPLSYPEYAASVLAGNAFVRSVMAAAFPVFGRAFYSRLGIGGGCSLLAGIAIIMIPCSYVLMKEGAYLRSRSKYATA
ncbi:hypothetical protein BS47DRAFT_1341426 [Hydnum rufescens UP504]|uniref:Major facilitator superfamily (MFS) profile domain-containing protein n=1 Tax=Hydnum rufescens UP504 TaxID=1448309 RepID=A0A9P6B1R0_9AGAM|nr:hypothetical protein BS47DRAFT_1341426 [Hydnum rufescens UP504]